MKSFQYLNNPDKPDNQVLMSNLPSMCHPFIVRDESTNRYFLFDSYVDFANQRERMTTTLHEVSVGGKQKLKFDIDAKEADILAAGLTRDEIMEPIMNSVAGWLATFANIDVPTAMSKLVIADSSNETKLSRHIVIDGYYVPNNEYAKAFYDWVVIHLEDEVTQFIDHQVYKSAQSLRIAGCHKVDAPTRIKKIISGHTIEQSLFTVIDGCSQLTTMGLPKRAKVIQPTEQYDFDIDAALSIVKPYTDGLRFNRVVNGYLLSFTRIAPSNCPICDTVHHNDNTLHAIVSQSGNIVIRCKHDTNDRSIVAGSINTVPTELGWSDQEYAQPKKFKYPTMPTRDTIPTNFKLKIVDQPDLDDFKFGKRDCIIAKSHMATGKTKALSRLIASLPDDYKVIIMSMRKTFTQQLSKSIKGFTVYSDSKGKIDAHRLIIQYESLHRLDLSKLANQRVLFVMDESESIINQIEHAKINVSESIANFQWLLKYSTQVIMMDANAASRTYTTAQLAGRQVKLIQNTHVRRPFNDVFYNEYTVFMRKFAVACKNAHKEPIAVCSSSKNVAIEIAACARAQNPNLRIQLYTREKTAEQIAELADVDASWVNYDVVIYTPTITAGVSFEKAHFHHMFVYLSHQSCDYLTAHQMTGRVRDVASKTTHIHVTKSSYSDAMLPQTLGEVRAALTTRAGMLLQGAGLSNNGSLEMTIAGDGITREYVDTFAFKIHCMNVLHKCQSVAQFRNLFERLRKDCGNKVTIDRSPRDEPVAAASKKARTNIKEARMEAIANSDVNEESQIIEKEVLTVEEANANAKLQLASTYGVELKHITKEFIKQYGKDDVKQGFYNANTILAYGAKSVREVVSQRLQASVDTNGDVSQVSLRSGAPRMLVGLAILEAITEQPLTSDIYRVPITIARSRLEVGLRAAAINLAGQKDFIKLEFKIDLDQILTLPTNKISQAVNRMIFKLFGLKFSVVRGAKNKATDDIKLEMDKSFIRYVDPDNQEYIRLRPITQ